MSEKTTARSSGWSVLESRLGSRVSRYASGQVSLRTPSSGYKGERGTELGLN